MVSIMSYFNLNYVSFTFGFFLFGILTLFTSLKFANDRPVFPLMQHILMVS